MFYVSYLIASQHNGHSDSCKTGVRSCPLLLKTFSWVHFKRQSPFPSLHSSTSIHCPPPFSTLHVSDLSSYSSPSPSIPSSLQKRLLFLRHEAFARYPLGGKLSSFTCHQYSCHLLNNAFSDHSVSDCISPLPFSFILSRAHITF